MAHLSKFAFPQLLLQNMNILQIDMIRKKQYLQANSKKHIPQKLQKLQKMQSFQVCKSCQNCKICVNVRRFRVKLAKLTQIMQKKQQNDVKHF